jgi:hypothetical protein
MSLYWIKNKSKGQQPIELTQKPTADEVFSIPPRAVKKIELTKVQAAYVSSRYSKVVNLIEISD